NSRGPGPGAFFHPILPVPRRRPYATKRGHKSAPARRRRSRSKTVYFAAHQKPVARKYRADSTTLRERSVVAPRRFSDQGPLPSCRYKQKEWSRRVGAVRNEFGDPPLLYAGAEVRGVAAGLRLNERASKPIS